MFYSLAFHEASGPDPLWDARYLKFITHKCCSNLSLFGRFLITLGRY